MELPLKGVKVLTLETSVSAPFCSMLLGDFGADVIKVEPPGRGDTAREWDTLVKGLSSAFVALNRNKRSLTLNVKSPQGREILERLIRAADVFLINFAPATVERLRLDYKSVSALNPNLVYCGISGFGKEGPYRDAKAYDLIIQGEAGLISLTGDPEKPAKISLSIVDLSSGLYAALAIALALYQRAQTGRGQEIEVSMFEATVSLLLYFPYQWWYGGFRPAREGMRHQLLVPYGPFKARDGKYVNLAILSNEDWKAFCAKVLGRPDLLADPRFESNELRVKNRRVLEELIEEIIAQADSDFWFRKLDDANLPHGRVNEIDEVLNHPQALFRNFFKTVESPAGEVFTVGNPVRASGVDVRRGRVPGLGEHTEEILLELGYTQDEIRKLREAGAV